MIVPGSLRRDLVTLTFDLDILIAVASSVGGVLVFVCLCCLCRLLSRSRKPARLILPEGTLGPLDRQFKGKRSLHDCYDEVQGSVDDCDGDVISSFNMPQKKVKITSNQSIEGRMCGIGITFNEEKDKNNILRVFVEKISPGSPAELSVLAVRGQYRYIEEGDTIVTVSGQNAYGLSMTRLQEVIYGKEGTYIKIGFQKQDGTRTEFDLKRFSPSVPKEIAMSCYEPPASIRYEESACNLSASEAHRNLYPEKNFDAQPPGWENEMKEELKKRKAVVMMPADVNMSARHLNTARHLNKLHRMESNNAIAGDLQEAPAKKLGCLSNKLKCLDFSATEDSSEYEGDGGGDNAPAWEKEHDPEGFVNERDDGENMGPSASFSMPTPQRLFRDRSAGYSSPRVSPDSLSMELSTTIRSQRSDRFLEHQFSGASKAVPLGHDRIIVAHKAVAGLRHDSRIVQHKAVLRSSCEPSILQQDQIYSSLVGSPAVARSSYKSPGIVRYEGSSCPFGMTEISTIQGDASCGDTNHTAECLQEDHMPSSVGETPQTHVGLQVVDGSLLYSMPKAVQTTHKAMENGAEQVSIFSSQEVSTFKSLSSISKGLR